MFITKLFLAAILAVALSAQTAVTEPKAPHDLAKTIAKKQGFGTQIDEALSKFKDGASKFDVLATNLENSLGCQNSVPEGTYSKMTDIQKTKDHECSASIRMAQLAFTANHMQIYQAEGRITLGMTRLVTLAASLVGPESGALYQYTTYLEAQEAQTNNNFNKRFLALTNKTQQVLDQLK